MEKTQTQRNSYSRRHGGRGNGRKIDKGHREEGGRGSHIQYTHVERATTSIAGDHKPYATFAKRIERSEVEERF